MLEKVQEDQKKSHLTEDNDCLSTVSHTAEDLTWDALTYVPVTRMNTHLKLDLMYAITKVSYFCVNLFSIEATKSFLKLIITTSLVDFSTFYTSFEMYRIMLMSPYI